MYVELTTHALKRFKSFYNEVGVQRSHVETPRMKAAWSKVEAVAARIALIVACARYVLGEKDREIVDKQDIEAGIAASRWFVREAERIEMALTETTAKGGRPSRRFCVL